MEIVNRRAKRGRKSPKVPIKTYKWEDIHRSRRRGGYPWTHLYKEPFYEHLDPEPWTMDGMRKAKSSSTMGKSEDFSISEVSTFDNRSAVEEILDNPSIDIKDKSHSIKTSCSSLNLEEQEIDDDIERTYEVIDKEDEDIQSPGMFFLHSEESSDDISQYLDKEERVPTEASKKSEDRLDPEEVSDRKRKLSADSSNSKLSLGKKAILQKFKDTKEKIKIPKITFHTKLKKPILKKSKNSPPQVKKITEKPAAHSTAKDIKPVYIHIPLKPPPGETDQFSDLENETTTDKKETRKPSSFRDLVKNIKHLQEPKIEHKHPSPIRELTEEDSENSHDKEIVEDTAKRLTAEDHPIIEEVATAKDEPLRDKSKEQDEAMEIVEIVDESNEIKEIRAEEKTPDSLPRDNDFFDKLFEASTSRERSDSQKENRKARSKSAEPERKRKLSLESSYSRKSLSKLGLLKKLRDAKDKIKNTLSRATSKKDIKVKEEPVKPEDKSEEKPKTQLKPKKFVEPVYIHIPLKPPDGQTDEYSHLENEARPIERVETQTETIASSPEDTHPPNGNVQLIILTAPSDDEILDDNSPDVPETPVSETKVFFPLKVHELKKIAQDAVEEVTNGTSKTLSPVTEEPISPKSSLEDIAKKALEEDKKKLKEDALEEVRKVEHMMVDEEDGLSETKKQESVVEELKVAVSKVVEELDAQKDESKPDKKEEVTTEEKSETIIEEPHKAIVEENQTASDEKHELKSVLKSPNSPVMKKKVSFKRKSRSKSSEDPGSEKDDTNLETIAVDEDRGDLEHDNDKDSSNKESDERWSKISDHDHEPVHLQQSNNIDIPTFTLNNTPAVVISADQALGSGDQDNYNLSTKHVYEEISENSQKRSPRPQRVVFSATTDSKSSDVSETEPKPKEGPSRFQAAFKQKADKFKTKLQNFKRPHINFPERPKFQKPNLQRFKIEKPKWNMPKIPDTAKINLPHFSLPRKGAKKPVKRISSTESTSGDSKRITFDFGTYPRIFKKKPKPEVASDFATVPRAKKTDSSKSTDDSRKSATDSIRIPLHSDDSVEKDNVSLPVDSSDLNRSSHIRYDEGIDSEDEYNKETREIMEERDFLSRWQRGRFNPDELMEQKRQHRVTDLDSPSEDKEFSSNNGKDQHYSSGSSVGVGVHRQGVIEEINPDEFFLRQKGISQDNIEVGMYLSTEIREAFRNPTNALVQMEQNNFDKGSHQSLPEMQSKRKPIKKPKRKKTPHASQERFQYEEEETADDEFDEYPPSRPKRRSKRKKKINEEFIPYQETIQVEEARDDRLLQHRESLGILADDERDFMYENEKMEGIEQPKIQITDPYKDYGEEEAEEEEEEDLYIPEAPPRLKPKNIKSLKTFEAGSVVQKFDVVATVPTNGRVPERISYHTKEKELVKEYEPEMINYHNKEKELEEYEPEISYELNITEPEIGGIEDISYLEADIGKNFNNYRYMDESIEDLPPAAPPRRQKSLKSLTISENESYPGDLTANRAIFSSEKKLEEPEIETIRTESKIIIPIEEEIPRPKRPSRSRSRGTGSRSVSQHSLALHSDSLAEENPVPCVEEPCMQTVCDYMGYTTVDRNKPRDPPLPPPRTLQRKKRSKKNQENNFFTVPRSKAQEEADAPVRPLRIYSTIGPSQKSEMENKENLDIEDIMQYIEQDDDRDLQSGEVIEKIKTRPLPTPPRPPRKIRPLSDITSRENIMIDSIEDLPKASTGETEVYTQTEPLPDDFVCEEMVQEATDRVIIPTQTTEKHRVKRELITPTVFTHEETITHGSLIVEPLNGAKILPDSAFTQRSKETLISVHVESDNEGTSFIPHAFHKLSNPKSNTPVTSEMDVLKAHKLQVIDLDVDTLTVNKLLADKIVVSEIDSSSIQTNEISSRTGALKVGEISFPPEVLEQIIKSIQSSHVSDELEKPNDDLGEQKKTPIESSPIVKSVSEHNFEVCPVAEPETCEELLSDVSLTETVPVEEISKEMPPIVSEVEEVSKEIPSLVSEEVSLNLEVHESPPEAPHRLVSENVESSQVEEVPREEEPPHRPPRQSERLKPSPSATELSIQEPEVDDEPPPRPPHPPVGYIPSQPPASFYALRAQKYVDENIPVVPRRRRATKSKQLTRSSSEESSEITPVVRRHHRRSSEPSIAQLSGQLIRACGSEANNALKRLITYILNNVFHNEDGKQDLHVMIIIILVLIAGLLLLGYGEERTVVHLHHWEYFNPPKDL